MPSDIHGCPIVPGLLYAIGRGTKKVVCETRYDHEIDELVVRRKGTESLWTRADEIDSQAGWVPVDEHGCEILPDDDCDAPEPAIVVRNGILRARALKDQLAAVEADLVHELGAHHDEQLRDAIMQAIHGDGSAETVLELVGA